MIFALLLCGLIGVSSESFQKCDKVRHNSASTNPVMVVIRTETSNGIIWVECQWFNKNDDLRSEWFQSTNLVSINKGKYELRE